MHAPAPALLVIAPLEGAHFPGGLIQGEVQRGLCSVSILGGKPEEARGRQRQGVETTAQFRRQRPVAAQVGHGHAGGNRRRPRAGGPQGQQSKAEA